MFVIGIDTDISTEKTIVEFPCWAKRRRLKCVCGLRRKRRRGKCVSRLLLRRRTADNTKKGEEEERERATCPHLAYNTTSTKKARKIEKISKKKPRLLPSSIIWVASIFDFSHEFRGGGGGRKNAGADSFFWPRKIYGNVLTGRTAGEEKKAEKKKLHFLFWGFLPPPRPLKAKKRAKKYPLPLFQPTSGNQLALLNSSQKILLFPLLTDYPHYICKKKLLSNYPTPTAPFPTYTERASALLGLTGRNVA